MIILKTSNFILFTLLIIIASIGIYIELFPCNCSSKKRNINIYRGKIKYVPIIIKDTVIINVATEIIVPIIAVTRLLIF